MREKYKWLLIVIIIVIVACAGLLALGLDGEIKTLFITNVIYLIALVKKIFSSKPKRNASNRKEQS